MAIFLSEYRATRRTGLFLIFLPVWVVASLLLFRNLGPEQAGKRPVKGGVFRIKSFADSFRMQLDPAQPDSYIFLSEQLYDGLVRLDKNAKIAPSLAEYWMISPDGKVYTFFLKKGVLFHHGEEVTAEDVKFSLERILDREVGSPYFHFFSPRVEGASEFREGQAAEVTGIRAVDRYKLEIHWVRPYVPALYLLSLHFCKILPRERVSRQGDSFFQKPVGTGPFQFDYWIRDNRLNEVGVRLKRNESYFQTEPYLDALEFSPFYTEDHFINGEIDCIPVLSERLRQPRYRIFQDGSLQTVFLGMSCHLPPLDNPTVRKAFQAGIDKQAVIDAVTEVRYSMQATERIIPSRIPGFYSVDDPLPCDRNKARRLIEEAGFSAGKEFPALLLFLDFPRTEFKRKFAREIRNQLESLGASVSVSYFRSPDQVRESDSPYLILVDKTMHMPDPEDMIRPLFSLQSESNMFGYDNPSVADLLHASESEKSWSRRIRIFQQIEKILLDDVPVIPIYSRQNRVALQPYVRGVAVPRLGMYYLDARKIWLGK
jgi:ABC-type transport system substrate-binding protein